MARSDSANLEALKTARDAIIDGIAEGRATVKYKIGNREHEVEPSSKVLANLEDLIQMYESKVSRSSTGGMFRLAKIQRPRGT